MVDENSAIGTICAAGAKAGLVGSVHRSTRAEQFFGKMKVFQDHVQRIFNEDDEIPSGSDVSNILKKIQQFLLGWMKESHHYFDEEKRQFDCREFPFVDYNLLCLLLLKCLNESKKVLENSEEFVDEILRTIACLVPFLPPKVLSTLPSKVASSIDNLPSSTHLLAINLICGYLLPLLLGAMPLLDSDLTRTRVGLSAPSILHSVFQACADRSLDLQVVETLMAYTRNVCGDLLYVMAYGTPSVLEPAIHMLNRYYPSVEIGTVAEYRAAHQEDKILFQRCESHACAKHSVDGFINTADLVCLDPKICSIERDSPPPLYLCSPCGNRLNKTASPLFVDVIRSIGNISEQCENPECSSNRRAGMHFCFSTECTKKNRRKPMRLCDDCNVSLHGQGRQFPHHIVHSSLFDLWSMKNPTQTYLVDTIARLLSQAYPPYRERCIEMGMDLDTVANIELPETRDANLYKKITRSLHGLGMLKALSPIPPSSYSYEHMGQLLSILFAWLEAVACTSHMHLKIVDIVERYQAQAIEWINKVEKYDFELYCDCLLPLPPIQARVGLPWESLMSKNRQQLEGLQRLCVLVKYGLVPEEAWERILPFWMQELKETAVGTDNLQNFKTVLRRLFDVKSPDSPVYSLNFIRRRLQNVVSSQRQEGLVWLQMLSALDVKLDFADLLAMFLESSSYCELSDDDETDTMFPFPDALSYRDMSKSSSMTSPAQSPFVSPKLASIQSSHTYYILLLDVLIKQLSLRSQMQNFCVDDIEAMGLTKLLVTIVDRRKHDKHENHVTETSCHYCLITGIFYYQITFLLDYILPKEIDIETRTNKRSSSRAESLLSSERSRVSSIGTVTDNKSLRRSETLASEPDFDDVAASCEVDVSSCGVEDLDGSAVGSVNTEESESESDSLSAWRDRVRRLSNDPAARTIIFKHDSLKEQASWYKIYRTNPEIELTVLLLQHIFKYNDAAILNHILKSITMLCVRGECLRVSAREDMDLTHYLQTVLFIPSLWEMLQSSNSYLAQQSVPLLLHCVCMPYGAGRLCDEIENVFNNEDWKKRFSAVEKVSLLCQFLSVEIIRDSSLAKSTLVHGFVYLVSAVDDVHDAVASRARTMLLSINETSLKMLYAYMEEHFQRESADRLMLLHALRSLNAVLVDTSPFSTKFFLKLFSHLTTKAKHSTINSSQNESIASWVSEDDSIFRSPHIPIWSRALSSPARATGISNWAPTGGMETKRPRSASAPLVLYKQKYTLQFDRQTSVIPDLTDENKENSKPTSQRQRRVWTPNYDPFSRGTNQDTSLLEGSIEASINETDEAEKSSQRSASLSSISLSSKSLILCDIDSFVLHYLVTIMMEYLADNKAVNEEKTTVEDVSDLISVMKSFMVALTNDCEGDISMRPDDLRSCTVFLAYVFGLTTVLDCNPFVGKELVSFTLQLLLQSVKDETNKTDISDLNLDRLDQPLQHIWLMNLLVILYKYSFSEYRTSIQQLVTIVSNSVNSHQHSLCINIPQSEATLTDGRKGRSRGVKKGRSNTSKKGRLKSELVAKSSDEVDFKDPNEEVFEMSTLRQDTKFADQTFSETETAYMDTSTTSEDSNLRRIDSSASASNDESVLLSRLFSSRKCDDCGCVLSAYEEDIVNLCIVVLSTFIHRDPVLAAPHLMDILCIVSRKCQNESNSLHSSAVKIPAATTGIAKQFIRCIFVQLSPNGLFAELFRCEIFDKDFFTAVVSSLVGLDVLDEMAPLANILQDFSSRSNRSDRVMIFLQNLRIYIECLPKDHISPWENLLHDLESFFKNLPSALPSGLEMSSVLRIMTDLLGIAKHFAKSLVTCFGNIVSHIVRKCDFQLQDLYELCYACYYAFSKEREKLFIVRTVHQDLALTMKEKIATHERNVKRIIQLVFLHGQSWFSFESEDVEMKRKFGSKEENIGVMNCVQMYHHEMIDFIKNWNFRLKDMRDIDDDSFDEHYFPIQLKASLAQILALFMKLKTEKQAKASARAFSCFRSAPSQLSRVDQILECVTNLQLLAWLLLGAINNAVDYPESCEVIHFISLAENLHIAEYIKNILQSVVRQDTEKNLRSLRPALYVTFITCQLWTVYCECHVLFHTNAESDPLATIMEFWSQITFAIVQLLNESDKVKLDLLLPFIKIMDGIARCSGYAFSRLSTLWFPLIHYYLDELPEDVSKNFKSLEEYSEKPDDPKPDLKDLVNSVRLRLARLKRAGNKFGHASVI